MRGPTWGRKEVTFQRAETRQSVHHFQRLPLLEKPSRSDTCVQSENRCLRKDVKAKQKTASRAIGLQGTSLPDCREPGPEAKPCSAPKDAGTPCPPPTPTPLWRLSWRLLGLPPFSVCALSARRIRNDLIYFRQSLSTYWPQAPC